jgi:hypothetical protein
MPRNDADGPAVVVPGAYRTLLEIDCRHTTEPEPRLYLLAETDEQLTEWEALRADGRRNAAALLEELLAAAEPLTVPRWRIGGNHGPALADVPMFRDRSIDAFVVFADDRVAPAEARGQVVVIGVGVTGVSQLHTTCPD